MIFLKQKIKNKDSGFSLLEMIFAIAIFSISAFVLIGIVIDSRNTTQSSGDMSKALLYAKEGIEATQTVRDNNWSNLTDGNHGLATSSVSGWVFNSTSDTIDNRYTRVINVSTSTPDYSWIKKITSTVTWPISGVRTGSVSLNTFLTDWKTLTIVESVVGGGGEEGGGASGCVATGGTLTENDGYTIHTFLLAQSGTNFTVTSDSCDVDVLVVAGGGAGGSYYGGGGGGAGGVVSSSTNLSSGSYSITVGAGGESVDNYSGSNGENSEFGSIIIVIGGGGGGGGTDTAAGKDGGSGGGGRGKDRGEGSILGGTGTVGQGNDGGTGIDTYWYAGAGGGGASGVGANVSGSNGGNGGPGVTSSINGSTYAGGGGGSAFNGVGTQGVGGSGIGGNGADGNASAGVENTGSGGGGSAEGLGGVGGSGIVIVRYLAN